MKEDCIGGLEVGPSLPLDESTPDWEVEGMSVLEVIDGLSGVVATELLSPALEERLGWSVGRTSVDESPLEEGTSTLDALDVV